MSLALPLPVLRIQRFDRGIYGYAVTLADHVMAEDTGLNSITECLTQACQALPDDCGALEIRYRGIAVGAFLLKVLHEAVQDVADRIVERFAEVVG